MHSAIANVCLEREWLRRFMKDETRLIMEVVLFCPAAAGESEAACKVVRLLPEVRLTKQEAHSFALRSTMSVQQVKPREAIGRMPASSAPTVDLENGARSESLARNSDS